MAVLSTVDISDTLDNPEVNLLAPPRDPPFFYRSWIPTNQEYVDWMMSGQYQQGYRPVGPDEFAAYKQAQAQTGFSTRTKVLIGVGVVVLLAVLGVVLWLIFRKKGDDEKSPGEWIEKTTDMVIPPEAPPTVAPGVKTYSPQIGINYSLYNPATNLCVVDYVYLGKEKWAMPEGGGPNVDMRLSSYVGGGFDSPRPGPCRFFQFQAAPNGGFYLVDPSYSPPAYLVFVPTNPDATPFIGMSHESYTYDFFISLQGTSGTLDGDHGGTISWSSPTPFIIAPLNTGWSLAFTRWDTGETNWLAFNNLSDRNSTQILGTSPAPVEWQLAACPAGPDPQCVAVPPPTTDWKAVRFTV